jgi:hypothetical protein
MAEMANNRLNSSDLKLDEQNKLEHSLSWFLNENELTKYENEIIKALPVVK